MFDFEINLELHLKSSERHSKESVDHFVADKTQQLFLHSQKDNRIVYIYIYI